MSIREGIDKEALAGTHRVIPAFGNRQGSEPIDAYLTSLEINEMLNQILTYFKAEVEKIENPYTEGPGTGVAHRMYEDFRQDVLKLLEVES